MATKAKVDNETGTITITGESGEPQPVDQIVQELTKIKEELRQLKEKEANRSLKMAKDDPNSRIVRSDKPDDGGGWVVKTKKPWNGIRTGIRFVGGYGIIPVSHKECERLAHLFEHDYGYEVYAANRDQLNQIRDLREGIEVEDPFADVNMKLMQNARQGVIASK